MSKNRSDDFDTMSFEPIRPDNPKYEQYFHKPVDPGDLSEFEDATPSAPNPAYSYEDDEGIDDYDYGYDYDDDYYVEPRSSSIAHEFASSGLIALVAIMASVIFGVLVMVIFISGSNKNNSTEPQPNTTTVTTTMTTEATSQISTTEATTSTTEATTTEVETTSTTETTTTEATVTEATTTEAVLTTTLPITQPTTQPTTEPTETPTETEPPTPSTTQAETDPVLPDDVVDLDPEIPGIQAPQ